MSAGPGSRDASFWAARPDLAFVDAPASALNLNAGGKRVTGPLQGFGQLWQKSYWAPLSPDISPRELIALWKAEFASFWPAGSRFYGSAAGIQPGESALLNLGFGNETVLATGILVMYADEESFSFMTPEGHSFAGWITFSADVAEGVTVARITALLRASDPLYELGMPFGGHRMEGRDLAEDPGALAERVGVPVPRFVAGGRAWTGGASGAGPATCGRTPRCAPSPTGCATSSRESPLDREDLRSPVRTPGERTSPRT